jgi:hypothetical protein
VGREAFEGLQSAAEVVGGDEVDEMAAELVMALVVEASDGSVLDSAVDALDLTVGPRVFCLGGTMLDVVPSAGIFQSMGPEALSIGDRLLDYLINRPLKNSLPGPF